LLGRGGDTFAAQIIARNPVLEDRIIGPGDLDPQSLANHLAACDLLIQPYSEGATSRRGSLIAGLALGVPTVTTLGELSEDFWLPSRAALFAPANDVAAMIELAEAALADVTLREELRARARDLYEARFAVGHTADALQRI
jgi:glycosyltransferase involved in cell wall biosynthesis